MPPRYTFDPRETEIGKSMTFRARVHLQLPGATAAADIGEQELDRRPIRYGRKEFWYDGKTQVSRVEQIDPTDWTPAR
jgi:hypothetical protein